MAKFSRIDVLNEIVSVGLVPLFYHPDINVMKNSIIACANSGIRLFEFTNRGDGAYEMFKELFLFCQQKYPNMMIGAGSILDPGTASLYISSGANFIVGSVTNNEVAKICNRRKIAYIPGCATPSEISYAEELGVEIVKIFPGSTVGGPEFVKNILGPTPWTKIMVTGGIEVNEENISSWIKAGAVCLGIGSNLFRRDYIKNEDYENITLLISQILEWIKKARD